VPRPLPDWDRLGFGFRETDAFFQCEGDLGRDPVWETGGFRPFGPVELSPAAAFFSYGLGIFEGLKARRAPDGRLLLFRHRDNAARFRRSAERLLLAPFPETAFVEAVEELVRRNARWVPPHDKGSLYLRPLEHAIEPKLGIRPCSRFWVLMFGCPVAGYFAPGTDAADGVRLKVLEQGRCAAGGTGAAKAIGNYAGGIALAHRWQREGFDDVLYLDARQARWLTETSGSNVFVKLRDGRLVTPALDDQILAGITRDSVIRVARERLGVAVEERTVALEEVLADADEVFCTGTAWTLQPVREIDHRGKAHRLAGRDLQRALRDEILGIQPGTRDDPFGWTTALAETGRPSAI
jgi:branched-chain amino acid aminotransferase